MKRQFFKTRKINVQFMPKPFFEKAQRTRHFGNRSAGRDPASAV